VPVLVALACAVPVGATAGASRALAVPRAAMPAASGDERRPADEAGTERPETTPGAAEGQPSAEELAALARAESLRQEIESEEGRVGSARTALEDAARAAGRALERYRTAVRLREEAEARAAEQQAALLQAQLDLAEGSAALGRWIRQAYLTGPVLSSSPTVSTLLAGASTDQVGLTAAAVQRVGDVRGRLVQALEDAREAQQQATATARDAATAASTAAAEADEARRRRDEAVARQQGVLAEAEARLERTAEAAATADRRARRLAEARRYAALLAGSGGSAGGGPVTGPVGDCRGGDLAGLPNGRLPLDALCPVWGSPGDLLRADAAHAFNRLSQAYAAQFGRPICVTDSYRPYEEQVAVYREKPRWAAVPGTSNHGWGTAMDLCGGIQSFASAQHRWMQLNAPGYGWFHPSWAQPGGSTPEPWHWEYGG
jgi:hypothetical protein